VHGLYSFSWYGSVGAGHMEILQERIDNKALPSNLDLATNFPKLTPKSIPVNLSDSTKQLTSIIEFADRSVGIDLNRDLS
ncbi:hypothetical protein, partial [Xanthomonas hortorum]|uniref:hypothetical protein n=1 Tax=Xanthomonas hortorum TaxID=56454 RepID=UPI001CA5DAC4